MIHKIPIQKKKLNHVMNGMKMSISQNYTKEFSKILVQSDYDQNHLPHISKS